MTRTSGAWEVHAITTGAGRVSKWQVRANENGSFGESKFSATFLNEADARLVAAAPELYDALLDLTALYATSPGADPNFVAKARAAIDKA